MGTQALALLGSGGANLRAAKSPVSRIGKRGFPSLRQHATGQYFWRENGKNTYVGRDVTHAQRLWAERFGARLAAPGGASASERAEVQAARAPTPSRTTARTLAQARDALYEVIDAQVSPEFARVFRFNLAPFMAAMGESRLLSDISPADLMRFRAALIKKYMPWSVNGRLSATRRLLTLCDDLEWVDRPFKLKLLGGVPVGETKPKAWTPEQVREKIGAVAKVNLNLARMLRLQWLACLRPFTVAEVVYGRWTEEAPGVLVLQRSKTEKQTGEKQRVCLSEAAQEELGRIERDYDGGRLYRAACKRAKFGAPHALRHSAATALANVGVPDELIETALGHIEPRVKRTYRPQKYHKAREALAVLAKLVPKSAEVGA